MESIVFSKLDAVENAMILLIESITTHNPSVDALSSLLSADQDVTESLQLLEKHQKNVDRIGSLKQQITEAESTYTTLSRLIEASRTEVLKVKPSLAGTAPPIDAGIPAPGGPGSSAVSGPGGAARAIPLDDLLRFARMISKFTVPPAAYNELFSPPAAAAAAAAEGADKADSDGKAEKPGEGVPASAMPSSAAATPAIGHSSAGIGPAGLDLPGSSANAAGGAGSGGTENELGNSRLAIDSLAEEQKAWLDHARRLQFFPWPNEMQIKGGALARVRNMSASDFVRLANEPSSAGADGKQSVREPDQVGPAVDGPTVEAPAVAAAEQSQSFSRNDFVAPVNDPLVANDFEVGGFDLFDPEDL